MSSVVVPWPTTRAVFLAKHAVTIAVATLHDLGERALVLLDRDLAVAITVEQLEIAHHRDMPRLEPQPLELLQRQPEILVEVEFGMPRSAVLIDLLLADLAVLIGVIALREVANPLAHGAPALVMAVITAVLAGNQIAGDKTDAGEGRKTCCDERE